MDAVASTVIPSLIAASSAILAATITARIAIKATIFKLNAEWMRHESQWRKQSSTKMAHGRIREIGKACRLLSEIGFTCGITGTYFEWEKERRFAMFRKTYAKRATKLNMLEIWCDQNMPSVSGEVREISAAFGSVHLRTEMLKRSQPLTDDSNRILLEIGKAREVLLPLLTSVQKKLLKYSTDIWRATGAEDKDVRADDSFDE